MSRSAFTRRQVVAAAGTAAFLPSACSAKAGAPQFTPEQFGATGDGRADDYGAFQRLAAAVNRSAGGVIVLRPGADYLLNRFVTAENGVADVTFQGCSGLAIEGNSASISLKGDFYRNARTTRGLAGMRMEGCDDVQIRDLELIGNVQQMSRPPTLAEAPSHGLLFGDCSNVLVERVTARHFAADGMYVRAGITPDPSGRHRASRQFHVRNSKFLFNARQGLSIIQLRGGLFEACEFSHTGYVAAPAKEGQYGTHSPGAGVDVEPNGTPTIGRRVDVLTGDILFVRCEMIGNVGATFVAGKYANHARFLERVTVESCQLECNDGTRGGQDGFIFDVPEGLVRDCTLQMRDKTAYLGWYPESDANPEFSHNVVYGRNPQRNRPMFAVRATRGAPEIEGNRFLGQQRRPKEPRGAWLVFIDNPNATFRRNFVFIPAAASPESASDRGVPAVFARARVIDSNIYETDLDVAGASFAVVYAGDTLIRNEVYRGRMTRWPRNEQ